MIGFREFVRNIIFPTIHDAAGCEESSRFYTRDGQKMCFRFLYFPATLLVLLSWCSTASTAEPKLGATPFTRQQLSPTYFSEGANTGDLNQDGQADIVCGPYWYAGPGFTESHEIYAPVPQPLDFYADNFFSWIYDFNRDGWNDVFVVGFPGTPAYVYENPGKQRGEPWPKHQVIDGVSNESPHFIQVTGNATPELVCTRGGMFGFATLPHDGGFGPWNFHVISDEAAPEKFGHGLGVGDINGDTRSDILTAGGWFEQPAQDAESARWPFHAVKFTNAYGGAEMYAYDVDGDGDNDVITSQAAHDYGLAWYEQDTSGAQPVFREHLIMGKTPEQNHYGLVFTELHSLVLADMNGDGLQDIVTGKTYWSHHQKSPLWDAGAVVYWFELVRTSEGVDWVPHRIDDESGIGRQVIVSDINGDKLPDVIVGGMKGAHVLIHPQDFPLTAKPKPVDAWRFPLRRSPTALTDLKKTGVGGAVEAESIPGVEIGMGGKAIVQDMTGFLADRWSNGHQLFWTGGKVGSQMHFPFDVKEAGEYQLTAVFTMASDYAIVRTLVDGEELRPEIDLYNFPDVISTGPLSLGNRKLAAGKHRLTIEITGSNPSAEPALMVGVDSIEVSPKP